MLNKLATLLLFFTLTASLHGQKYTDYSNVERLNGVPTKDGEYYVLVSAEWCTPCKQLKESLKAYPEQVIYTVDFDREPSLASMVMGTRKTIPTFVKYGVTNKVASTNYWSGSNLAGFMPTKTETNNILPQGDVQGNLSTSDFTLFSRIAERIDRSNAELKEEISKLRSDRETILQLLRNIREDNAEFRRELLSSRTERTNILFRLSEIAEEREGLLKAIQDSRKELRDSRQEVNNLTSRFERQERRFTPLLNLLDRFDALLSKLTQSIIYLVGFTLLIIFILFIAMFLLLLSISAMKKMVSRFIPNLF